jgi:hypothetical protein
MKRYGLILALAVLAATQSLAADMPVNADGLAWAPAPPVLPKGAEIAVLSGDPSKDGLYVLRLKMPANYELPAHNHPTTEYVTVISGSFHIGMGDKLDEKNGVELRGGGFGEAPAHMKSLCVGVRRHRGPGTRSRPVRNNLRESGRRSQPIVKTSSIRAQTLKAEP